MPLNLDYLSVLAQQQRGQCERRLAANLQLLVEALRFFNTSKLHSARPTFQQSDGSDAAAGELFIPFALQIQGEGKIPLCSLS